MRVALGVPVAGPPTWGFTESLLGLTGALLGAPDCTGYAYIREGSYQRPWPIAEAHERIARRFLQSDCEWLLMLDQDAVVHPRTLERLLSWRQPVVAALSPTRRPPLQPQVYAGARPDVGPDFCDIQHAETRAWLLAHPDLCTSGPAILDPAPADSLRAVAFTGFHCMLVARAVIARIPEPRFERRINRPDSPATGCDTDFCGKARAAGFPVYVDRSVIAGHQLGPEYAAGGIDLLAWDAITDWQTRHYRIDSGRLVQLRECVPQLFARQQRLLYVGARPGRCELAPELAAAGNTLDLLEIWPDNAAYYREKGAPFAAVYEGDVTARNITPGYDAIIWWHGPEHVEKAAARAAIARLEAAAPLVVLATPWGHYAQGAIYGNPHEEHISAWTPDDFTAQSYQVAALGRPDEVGSHLLAWKETR